MKQHVFNIHDVVLIMTMSQCLLMALLQQLLPTQHTVSRTLLTFFFLLVFLNTAGILLLWNQPLQSLSPYRQQLLPLLLAFSCMLKGPILWLYLRSICISTFQFNYRHAIHGLPCAITLVTIIGFNISADDLLTAKSPLKQYTVFILWTCFKLSPVVYALLSALVVRDIGHTLMNHYSQTSEMGTGWANILTIGYSVHWSWSLLIHLSGAHINISISDTFGIIDNYLSFIMINLLFVYALFYARRLIAINYQQQLEPHTNTPTSIDDENYLAAIEKVNNGIQYKKLYLQQNINIEQFADKIGLTTREASQVINTHFGCNFFEFINTHRVEEAKRMLASSQYSDATILDILYQSGFNSKSAFQRFFKRVSGMTPSEYRKEHAQI